MSDAFLYGFGSGGTQLNFQVVAYGSEAALPAAPVENTIAVITDTAITSYIFSADKPQSGKEGMVWIQTGTASTVGFNALKANGIQVYPLEARQYVGGSWLSRDALSYQEGTWVKWQVCFLYDSGIQFTDMTGGWAAGESAADVSMDDAFMTLAATSSDEPYAHVVTQKAINLSGYSTLRAAVTVVSHSQEGTDGATQCCLGYGNAPDINLADVYTKTSVEVTGTGELTISHDISSIIGSCYILFGINGSSMTVRVNKVWLQ